MKKSNLPEDLGMDFSDPQIFSINNGNKSFNLSEERTYTCDDHCGRDCGCQSTCHTPWWERVLCGSQCGCEATCSCHDYICDCDNKCRCHDHEPCSRYCSCNNY